MQRNATISKMFLLFSLCILPPVMGMHLYTPLFDGDLYPALFEAVKGGNDKAVKEILDYAKAQNIPLFLERYDSAGTPLQWACDSGEYYSYQHDANINIVKMLLAAGANPSVETYYVPTPLICAARNCKLEIMQELLNTKYKEDILACEWEKCPLELCKEMSEFIQPVDPGQAENLRPNPYSDNKPLTALAYVMIAQWPKHYPSPIAKVDENIDSVSYNPVPNDTSRTKLDRYYELFKYKALKLLVDAGADVNITITLDTRHGYYRFLPLDFQHGQLVAINPSTPLLIAAGHGEKAIVQFLLNHGANPFAQSNGRTALDIVNDNAINHNPSIYEPARDMIPMIAQAQEKWRLTHPDEEQKTN